MSSLAGQRDLTSGDGRIPGRGRQSVRTRRSRPAASILRRRSRRRRAPVAPPAAAARRSRYVSAGSATVHVLAVCSRRDGPPGPGDWLLALGRDAVRRLAVCRTLAPAHSRPQSYKGNLAHAHALHCMTNRVERIASRVPRSGNFLEIS